MTATPAMCPCNANAANCTVSNFNTMMQPAGIRIAEDKAAYLLGQRGVRCVGIRGYPKSSTTFTAGLVATLMANHSKCLGSDTFLAHERRGTAKNMSLCSVFGSAPGDTIWARKLRAWQPKLWGVFSRTLPGEKAKPLGSLANIVGADSRSTYWAWSPDGPRIFRPSFNKHRLNWPVGLAVIAVLRDPRAVMASIYCWPKSAYSKRCQQGLWAPPEYALDKVASSIDFMTSVLDRLARSEGTHSNDSVLVLHDTMDAAVKARLIAKFMFPSWRPPSWQDAEKIVMDTARGIAKLNNASALNWHRSEHARSSCHYLTDGRYFDNGTVVAMSKLICNASRAIRTQFATCHQLERQSGDSIC